MTGDTRLWVYTRLFNTATGLAVSAWVRNGVVCLGPDAPGLDPRIAVIAMVRRDFAHFPLESAVVVTRPSGQSLVNAVTLVTSSVDGVDVLERTILGLPVVVHAMAVSYVWHFGDGASQLVPARAGLPGDAGHAYRVAGAVGVSLDVIYGGTFTVGGSPEVYDVQGTATIPGPAVALAVLEARTQLEAGSTTS